MARRSTIKGSAFERDIACRLSLWWSLGQRDDLLWRSSQSGGRATTRAKRGKKTEGHYGDLAATCEEGRSLTDILTFELKRGYSAYSPYDIFDRRESNAVQVWEKWINQAAASAAGADSLIWSIIARRDRKNEMIFFPARYEARVSAVFPRRLPKISVVTGWRPKTGLFGMRFSDFVDEICPIEFARIFKCSNPFQ